SLSTTDALRMRDEPGLRARIRLRPPIRGDALPLSADDGQSALPVRARLHHWGQRALGLPEHEQIQDGNAARLAVPPSASVRFVLRAHAHRRPGLGHALSRSGRSEAFAAAPTRLIYA